MFEYLHCIYGFFKNLNLLWTALVMGHGYTLFKLLYLFQFILNVPSYSSLARLTINESSSSNKSYFFAAKSRT